jgi:hypothetical protein
MHDNSMDRDITQQFREPEAASNKLRTVLTHSATARWSKAYRTKGLVKFHSRDAE